MSCSLRALFVLSRLEAGVDSYAAYPSVGTGTGAVSVGSAVWSVAMPEAVAARANPKTARMEYSFII